MAFQDNRASFGFYDGDGGAISNRGTLEVYSSVFERNRADFGDSGRALGGAIFNGGLLTLRDSLFSENVTNGDDVVALGGRCSTPAPPMSPAAPFSITAPTGPAWSSATTATACSG